MYRYHAVVLPLAEELQKEAMKPRLPKTELWREPDGSARKP
jgi:hypothetical protein